MEDIFRIPIPCLKYKDKKKFLTGKPYIYFYISIPFQAVWMYRFNLISKHVYQMLGHFQKMYIIFNLILLFKGCGMGRSDKVSLWYVALLIDTRFRFFILE